MMGKAAAIIFGLLLYTAGITGAVMWFQKQSFDYGEKTCQLAQVTAAAENLSRAQEEILDVFYDQQLFEDTLTDIPADAVRPSDPMVKCYYRQLRTQPGNAADWNACARAATARP